MDVLRYLAEVGGVASREFTDRARVAAIAIVAPAPPPQPARLVEWQRRAAAAGNRTCLPESGRRNRVAQSVSLHRVGSDHAGERPLRSENVRTLRLGAALLLVRQPVWRRVRL